MFNLVYASTAVQPFSRGELLALLQKSHAKNAALGITGLLIYKHGCFMQALEGDEAAVRALYAVIQQDPRHHHIFTLVAMPVAKRQFPDWSMGLENLDHADLAATLGYKPVPLLPRSNDELSWQASVALSLLATFAREN